MVVSDQADNWCDLIPKAPPLLFVLSGPSGVGKDAVITSLKRQRVKMHFAVTVTTRPMRSTEVEGVDYYFVSPEVFAEMRDRGDLLEWAVVHGNLYGTPLPQIRRFMQQGEDVLLKIDVQGAAQVKNRVPNAVFIFLAPPSLQELIRRLCDRGTETGRDLQRRIANAREELRRLADYDYVVVNREGRLHEAVEQIKSIVTAERLRVRPRAIRL